MRDPTLKAYLLAAAAAAAAMDAAFFGWSGAYQSVQDLSDILLLPVGWLITTVATLLASAVPAAVMVGVARRFGIRSLPFFVGGSSVASIVLAYIVAGLIWSPDVPPQDPDYLSFQGFFGRIGSIFACGGSVGGFVYWAVEGRRAGHSA